MHKKRLRHISLLLFFIFVLNLCTPCFSVQGEVITLSDSFAEDNSLTELDSFLDIGGHWAEKEITVWTTHKLAGGYPDGTFRPDSPITRAEFVTLVNRAFGYTNVASRVDLADKAALDALAGGQANNSANYRDVAETDWYAVEFANAAVLGYIGGYPDGTVKPQNQISRQEVAAVFAKILPTNNDVPTDNNGNTGNTDNKTDRIYVNRVQGTLAQFADQAQIPEWSQTAIAAAVSSGYMNGYPDGTFQPDRAITRAEAISVLDRAVGQLYNRAGTYGPFQGNVVLEGNVTISTAGVTLQNTTITGDLYLTEGIGEGDVALINVTVQGITKIAGGGRDSIHLRNTSLGVVLVNVPSHMLVRVLAQGDTAVGPLEARTPARLEEEGLTGSGFTKVVVNTRQTVLGQEGTLLQEGTGTKGNASAHETEPGINVELLGNFNEVEVQSAAAQLNLQKGSITNLTLASTAQAGQINLAAQTSINTLTADAPVIVQGQGTVETTQANVNGVVIDVQAKKVFLADGVQANVGGKTITEDYQYTEPKKKKSKDAALSDLKVDGKTVDGFDPDTIDYVIELPYSTTEVPEVTATARHAKARVEVTQATGLTAPDNVATVVVTAENKRKQTETNIYGDLYSCAQSRNSLKRF